jgi:hypothetical protein
VDSFLGFVGFEWNEAKAQSNLAKHGVSFAEALTVFSDPLARERDDPRHAEDRYVLYGRTQAEPPGSPRMLVVVYAYASRTIRIISAREMTPREKREYANRA